MRRGRNDASAVKLLLVWAENTRRSRPALTAACAPAGDGRRSGKLVGVCLRPASGGDRKHPVPRPQTDNQGVEIRLRNPAGDEPVAQPPQFVPIELRDVVFDEYR